MQLSLTQLLNLPGIEVENYTNCDDHLILEVEAYSAQATCPRCHETSHNLHQNHWYFARDLSISGKTVFLKVNRRQFKCHTCGKPFSEVLDFISPRRKQTDRFSEFIVKQVIHSDVRNVALNNGLTEAEVWSMVEYISKKK